MERLNIQYPTRNDQCPSGLSPWLWFPLDALGACSFMGETAQLNHPLIIGDSKERRALRGKLLILWSPLNQRAASFGLLTKVRSPKLKLMVVSLGRRLESGD